MVRSVASSGCSGPAGREMCSQSWTGKEPDFHLLPNGKSSPDLPRRRLDFLTNWTHQTFSAPLLWTDTWDAVFIGQRYLCICVRSRWIVSAVSFFFISLVKNIILGWTTAQKVWHTFIFHTMVCLFFMLNTPWSPPCHLSTREGCTDLRTVHFLNTKTD